MTDCPTNDELHQLLLGHGDATTVATWERHITDCPTCAERAASLPTDDAFVQSVRRAAPAGDTPQPEVVATLVQVFRQMKTGASETASWSGPPLGKQAVKASTAYISISDTPDELGRIGPFIIREVLGSGGMGVVYRGFDTRLEREVAIKVVRPELLKNTDMAERFLAEARAAAAVQNDHIVTVYSAEEHGGVSCIAMPLLKGDTLDKRLRKAKGPLPIPELVRVARQVTTGLAAAHGAGLVHRDIKPGNLWVEETDGRVKILDFGLAIPAETGGDVARFAGTPGYMAPEQTRSQALDGRADLFSLGCVLYHAATGKPPFPAETPIGMIVRTVTFSPPPTAQTNPNLPPALANLIDRLLAKSPELRPDSAAAVLAELDAIDAAELASRKRTLRRRVIASLVAAVILGGGGVWAAVLATAPKPVPPVAVAFEFDSDVGPLILSRDGTEWPLDPKEKPTLELPPGDYTVRAATPLPARELSPSSFIVLPKEPKTVPFALVGEMAQSAAHTGPVTGIAAVGERLTVFSASLDRTLSAWQPGTVGVPRFATLASPATSLAASRDGSIVAVIGGNKAAPFDLAIHLFDGSTLAKHNQPLTGHTRRCSAVGISADGKQLISAAQDELWLWNVATGTRRELLGHAEGVRVTAIAFDPARGQALTGGDDGFAILWDTTEAKLIRKFIAQAVGSNGGLGAIAFTPTGFVTSGDDGKIRLWNRETFQAREVATAPNPIRSLAVSPDGQRLLAGGDDGILRLWQLPEGALIREFAGHTKPIRGVCFSPDGRAAATGSDDRTVRLWRLPH